MVPASLHPRIEKQQLKKSNLALPSGKTISDFALDPYAGLLSTKEREWLIKIHLIQCLGTGDPMTDDYYYAVSFCSFFKFFNDNFYYFLGLETKKYFEKST